MDSSTVAWNLSNLPWIGHSFIKCHLHIIQRGIHMQNELLVSSTGIIVDFGKKKHLKKHPSKEKKYICSKKGTHFAKKKSTFGAEKRTSKHYLSNKKQQKSTYN